MCHGTPLSLNQIIINNNLDMKTFFIKMREQNMQKDFKNFKISK